MPKSLPPALGLNSFSCPHCGALAHQTWFALSPKRIERGKSATILTFADFHNVDLNKFEEPARKFVERLKKHDVTYDIHQYNQGSDWNLHNAHASLCHSCEGWALWVKDSIVYPTANSEILPHEDIPDNIKNDFDEAAKIVDISPRSAAALLRLCIQKLMPLLGEKSDNLNAAIGSLVKKGLEPQVQQALDVVRVIGNNAVHPGQIDLRDDKATATRLFEIFNLIVERTITTPKKLNELFKGLPPGALEAIQKRDER
jgi:hypothetical protein